MATTNEIRSCDVESPLTNEFAQIISNICSTGFDMMSHPGLDVGRDMEAAEYAMREAYRIYVNQKNDDYKLRPFIARVFMEQLIAIEKNVSSLKVRINELPHTEQKSEILDWMARSQQKIKRVKVKVNEWNQIRIRQKTLQRQNAVEPCTYKKERRNYKGMIKEACRPHPSWADQMEELAKQEELDKQVKSVGFFSVSLDDIQVVEDHIPPARRNSQTRFVRYNEGCIEAVGNCYDGVEAEWQSTVEGAILSGIAQRGMAFAGKAARDLLGLSKTEDAPEVHNLDPSNWSLANVPREVSSLAFLKEAKAEDASKILQLQDKKSMSLLERCKVPTLLTSTTLTANCASASTIVTQISVTPQSYHRGVTSSNVTVEYGGPLSYFARFFKFWRGDLHFDVQVIATEFHKGQIYVAFNPNMDALNTTSIDSLTGLMGASFDISEQNQFTFTVPYVNTMDYAVVHQKYGFGTSAAAHNTTADCGVHWMDSSIGRLYVYTQNPIIAPSTANPSMYVNVWVRAGENFEFAVPVQPRFITQVNGAWQSSPEASLSGNDELITNAEEPVEGETGMDGIYPGNPIANVTEVVTAGTDNIAGRKYLVRNNVIWNATGAQGTSIFNYSMPAELLNKTQLPMRGLMDYHEFLRGGMTFTIQASSQKQYCGLAIIIWKPSGTVNQSDCLPSLTQLPHTFFDLGRQTTAELDVPFNRVARLIRLGGNLDLGILQMVIVNPLLAPAGACTQVRMSVQARINKPYVGVKKAHAVTFQSNTGDAIGDMQESGATPQANTGPSTKAKPSPSKTSNVANKISPVVRPFVARNPPVKGYIGGHMSVYDLVKRPRAGHRLHIATPQDDQWIIDPQFDAIFSKLAVTYNFWNGGWKLHLSSDFATSDSVVARITPIWSEALIGQLVLPKISMTPLQLQTDFFAGTVMWKANLEPYKVVHLPYYARFPVLNTVSTQPVVSSTRPTHCGTFKLEFDWNASASGLNRNFFVCTSVADDFCFYFPMPIPPVQILNSIPTMVEEVTNYQNEWLKDLTEDGDVESNPGPTVIRTWVKNQLSKMIDDLAYEKTELVKQKLAEVSVFLRKHLAYSVIDDVIVPVLSVILDIGLHLRLLVLDHSFTTVTAVFTAITLRVYGVVQDANAFIERVRDCFEGIWNHKIPGESPVDGFRVRFNAAPMLPGIVAAVALSGIVGAVGYKLRDKTVKEVQDSANSRFLGTCRSLGTMGGAIRGAKEIWKAVRDGLMTAMDYFMEPEPAQAWWRSSEEEVRNMFKEYTERKSEASFAMNNMLKVIDHLNSFEWFAKIDYLLVKAIAHFPNIKEVTIDDKRLLKEILQTKSEVVAMKAASAPRCEPVGVWLSGGAGVGKSVFGKEVLTTVLHSALKLPGSWQQAVYHMPRSSKQDFFDGYAQQPICYVDDFGQNTDDIDFSEVINFISSANCPLPQARLDDKLSNFNSKVYLVSSNRTSIHGITTIVSHDAIKRRFPIAVEMKVKKTSPFSTAQGFVDYAALTAALSAAQKTPDSIAAVYDSCYLFQKIDILNGIPLRGELYTFKQLVLAIVSEVKKREMPHPMGDQLSQVSFSADWTMDPGTSVSPDGVERAHPFASLDAFPPIEEEPKFFEGFTKILALVGISAGVSIAAYFFINMLRSYLTEKVCTDINFQHNYTTKEHNRKVERTKTPGIWNADDRKIKIQRQVVDVATSLGGAHGIALDSKTLLVNYHLILGATGQLYITYNRQDGVPIKVVVALENNWQVCTFGKTGPTDCCVVHLAGVNLDGMRDLRSQLRTQTEWFAQMFSNKTATFMDKPCTYIPKLHRITNQNSNVKEIFAHVASAGFDSSVGDCGIPYFADYQTEHILMGFHSGNAIKGDGFNLVITPFCKEDIIAAELEISKRTMVLAAVMQYDFSKIERIDDGGSQWDSVDLAKFGRAKLNGETLDVLHLTKTDFIRSPIQCEEWSDDFLPSQKKVIEVDGVRIHPLLSNINKYKLMCQEIRPSIFIKAVTAYNQEVPDGVGTVFTDDQALNGYGEMNKVVRKTSAGYITRFIKKADLLIETPGPILNGIQEQSTYTFSERARKEILPCYGMSFCDYLAECERHIVRRQQPILLWSSTSKDELRPKEKVRIGKTRVFEVPDFILTILFRKYFGSFLNWYKSRKGFDMHHAIGIDTEIAFQEIYDGLRWKERVFDLDYSNFDGSIFPFLFDFFRVVTDKFYSKTSQQATNARHTLIECLRSSLLIAGDTLFLTAQGNKSGNPMTDVFNSVTNSGFIYMAFAAMYGDEVRNFRKHVDCLCYGDDVIMDVDEECRDFNRISLAQVGEMLGLKITPANKTSKLEEFTPIEEISFLKAKFRPGVPFRNPLPLEVIHRELQWERRQNHGDQLVLDQRIQQACQMILHHPKEEWIKLRNQIARAGFIQYLSKTTYEEESLLLASKQFGVRQLTPRGVPCYEAQFTMKRAPNPAGPDAVRAKAMRSERSPHTWRRYILPHPQREDLMWSSMEFSPDKFIQCCGRVPTIIASPCFVGVKGVHAYIHTREPPGISKTIPGRKIFVGNEVIFILDPTVYLRENTSQWFFENVFAYVTNLPDYYRSMLTLSDIAEKGRFGLSTGQEYKSAMEQLGLIRVLPNCKHVPVFDFVQYQFMGLNNYCGDGTPFGDKYSEDHEQDICNIDV